MIRFDNWTIQADGDILARQFDNLTRTLAVAGDIPAGWEWDVLVQVDGALDIIPLIATEGALSAVLTAQQLSIAGRYNMQLRGVQGELVKHTNTVNVHIPKSLSGDEQWPEIPSEFTQLEQRVKADADRAEEAAKRAEGAGGGGEGGAGKDGGYYTPDVTQTTEDTMQVAFTPSNEDMPAVPAVMVALPSGADGKDGSDGAPGKDGEPGADGAPGADGKDGGYYIPHVEQINALDVRISFAPSEENMPEAEDATIRLLEGAPGTDGVDGSPGADGKDGVSCSHEWNGTVLTIVSASGSSSADLKGEPGKDGTNGADGYTPRKGVDYYTEADKQEIVEAVSKNHYTKDEIDKLAEDLVTPIYERLNGVASELYVEETIDAKISQLPTEQELVAAVIAALPNAEEVLY